MKKSFFALVLIFVVLLFSSIDALTLNAPKNVPASVNWYVSIELSGSGFDSVVLSVDGAKVLEQPMQVGKEATIDVFYVIHKEVMNNKIFVVLKGLPAGEHSLKVETRQNGSVVDSIDWDLTVFEAMSAKEGQSAIDEIEDIKADVSSLSSSYDSLKSSLEGKINELNSSLEKLNHSINELEKSLSGQSAEIDSLKSALSSLGSDLASLNSKLAEASVKTNKSKEELAVLSQKVKALDLQLNPPESETGNSGFFSGLVSIVFAPENIPAVGLFIMVIVSIVVIFLFKRNSEGPLFEGTAFEPEEDKEASFDSSEAVELTEKETEEEKKFKGKWAYNPATEGGSTESESKSGISFSELLWKKR